MAWSPRLDTDKRGIEMHLQFQVIQLAATLDFPKKCPVNVCHPFSILRGGKVDHDKLIDPAPARGIKGGRRHNRLFQSFASPSGVAEPLSDLLDGHLADLKFEGPEFRRCVLEDGRAGVARDVLPEPLRHHLPHGLAARRGGHHCLRSTSRVTSFSNRESASNFFNRVFSISSSFNRFASDTLMPPTLLRQR